MNSNGFLGNLSADTKRSVLDDTVSDEQLESLASIEDRACTQAGTKICTCGGNATCHHHD